MFAQVPEDTGFQCCSAVCQNEGANKTLNTWLNVSGNWVMLTVNTLAVIVSVFSSDLYIHAAADLLVESLARAAEKMTRYESGIKLKKDVDSLSQLLPLLLTRFVHTSHVSKKGFRKHVNQESVSSPMEKVDSASYSSIENPSKHFDTNKHLEKTSTTSTEEIMSSQSMPFSESELRIVVDKYMKGMKVTFVGSYSFGFVVLLASAITSQSATGLLIGWVDLCGITMADMLIWLRFSKSAFYSTSSELLPSARVGGLPSWQLCCILILAR